MCPSTKKIQRRGSREVLGGYGIKRFSPIFLGEFTTRATLTVLVMLDHYEFRSCLTILQKLMNVFHGQQNTFTIIYF